MSEKNLIACDYKIDMTGFVKIILSRFRKSNVNIPCIWIVIYTLQHLHIHYLIYFLNSANSLSTHLNFEFSSFWEKKLSF